MIAKLSDGVGELVEETLATQVAGHREVPSDTGVDAHEVGELQDETGREIIDAEVSHVLKDVHGLRPPTAGHARDDDDVGHAIAVLGCAHLLTSGRHVTPPLPCEATKSIREKDESCGARRLGRRRRRFHLPKVPTCQRCQRPLAAKGTGPDAGPQTSADRRATPKLGEQRYFRL